MARTRRPKPSPQPMPPVAAYEHARAVADKQSRIDVITPEQRAKGTYEGEGMRVINRDIVEEWFAVGGIGFEHGAKLAVEWCHRRWEARGIIGKQAANYEPTIGGGAVCYEREIEMRDELDDVREWFHPEHWAIFENVVRWGQPAGCAGSSLASNNPQSTASAKTVVGMIASFIAAKRGY